MKPKYFFVRKNYQNINNSVKNHSQKGKKTTGIQSRNNKSNKQEDKLQTSNRKDKNLSSD